MLYNLLFPQLAGRTWAKVNLNDIALEHNVQLMRGEIADQPSDEHWIDILHQGLGVDHSWGGWLEARHFLLRNQYHKDVGPDHFWHLGVDYNVPAGTEVHMPVDAWLDYGEMDRDQDGGWGGKLIFYYKPRLCYFILGHLDRIVQEERDYKAGEVVAVVGERSVNGNWFPHLHVQCMVKLDLKVDGYSHWYDGIERDFPNPALRLGVT